jgi:hypothetical protein
MPQKQVNQPGLRAMLAGKRVVATGLDVAVAALQRRSRRDGS